MAREEVAVRTYRQEDHRGWGNSIQWSTKPHEIREGLFRRRRVVGKLVGWLWRHPEVGDRFVAPMQSGRNAVFTITGVTGVLDPMDMFYAGVEFAGYEGDE